MWKTNEEIERPSVDIHGVPIHDGDIVRISSRGFLLTCFIADESSDGIIPADEDSRRWEQWCDSPDWDTVEFVRRPGPRAIPSAG